MYHDHKPLEKFLKGKTEKNKTSNCIIQLYSYKLNSQYINSTKHVLEDCLFSLVMQI